MSTRELRLRRACIEHQIAERRWFVRVALLFGVLVLAMICLAGVVRLVALRAEDREVRAAGVRVQEATHVLRDLQVVESHAANHPESYRILDRQRDEVWRRRTHYNMVVARYNRTRDLPYVAWLYRWLNLPPQHQYISLND